MGALQGPYQPEMVAVKMVRGPLNDSVLRKFLKEVHTWSKLENEHILPLRGVTAQLGWTLSIISPWMANGSARNYVSTGAVDPGPLLRDVAEGLHYLHNRDDPVYHGDLKGENVLISNGGRALLADFGFSALGDSSFSLSISQPLGGSPLWMAPEKLDGYDDSEATDVYSFAMLTLELFTRQNPFQGETSQNMIQDIKNGRRPRRPNTDSTLNRLTNDWWRLCQLCWDNDPAKRWTTNEILRFRPRA
ncbi:kinase-like domain-containing protein [Mycena metata]|uniref:Kinase-like domain-containing protein n=1 Tax=Mycena metata TaxID=1033252 RepID=A0AAD7IYA9_9AGAR|nr:kinase-like domain-containing protein [Mycena metata]